MVDAPTDTQQAPEPIRYSYNASLAGSGWRFELDDKGIVWHFGRRTGCMLYQDIASVTMTYRPVSMQAERYRTDIAASDGTRLSVLSVTRKSFALVESQGTSYRTFVLALHQRLASSHGVTFRAGLSHFLYGVASMLATLVGLAVTALFVRALLIGSWAGALFMVGFAALFTWQIGGFLLRNRPEIYPGDKPPLRLFPAEADGLANDSRVALLKKIVSRSSGKTVN